MYVKMKNFEYYNPVRVIFGAGETLPTMMIPTLPATGSEMNLCAVVSNRALQEKSYIWAPCLYPKTSIIDPELTVSLLLVFIRRLPLLIRN